MNSMSCKYAAVEANAMNQTELEVRALVRTASSLNAIKENWEEKKSGLESALNKNRRLWTIFATEMGSPESLQPTEVKNNILNLANFVFKRTVDILVDPKPESLNVLIDININIARGLSEANCGTPVDAGAEVIAQPIEQSSKAPEPLEEEYDDIFGD